ncbi:hypothetical protein D9M71_317940 [compost metagenome]
MAHGFVQQHARPARAQHYRQGTGRCRDRFQIHQGLAQGLAGIAHHPLLGEVAVIGTPATALPTAFTTAVLLDDHADVEAHQRAYVGSQAAIGRGNQNAFPDPGHAHADLLNARVQGTGGGIDTLKQLDLFGTAEHVQRVVRGIQSGHLLAAEGLHRAVLPGTGNRTGGTGCRGQRFKVDRVAVGEAGFFAGLGTHAHALVEVEAALFDDTVLQRPGFRDLALEIQVGGVDAGASQLTQHALQAVQGQAAWGQELLTDGG